MAKENKIRTGIFGGSFNPIHIGHLALANYLCEYSELDEIWFLVSPHNPLKKQTDLWQKACQFLDFTDMKVNQVCYRVGIEDAYYFSRLFSQIMGMSPREYKKVKKG